MSEDADECADDLSELCATQPAPNPRGNSLRIARMPFGAIDAGSHAATGKQFFEEYVRGRKPIIITGSVDHWPALSRWTNTYLKGALGDHQAHVARTPDGLGDAVTRHFSSGDWHFAKPHEALMPFAAFVDAIETPLHDALKPGSSALRAVHYCSHQNSSLTSEFQPLWQDVEQSLPWADAAFGRPPAATNFWMGEDAARTTVHADLFDNLYVVVRGTKEFTLLPPQEGHLLQRARYRAGTYAADLTFELDEPPCYVHWTHLDIEGDDVAEALRPVRASVSAGELLYLPALWWHAVSQKGDADGSATTAVNYWYEGPVALGDEAEAAADRAADRLLDQLKLQGTGGG